MTMRDRALPDRSPDPAPHRFKPEPVLVLGPDLYGKIGMSGGFRCGRLGKLFGTSHSLT